MAVAKYSAPGTASANLASTALDGLANDSTSAFLSSYANGTNLDLYASAILTLGTLTPAAGGSVTLRVFAAHGATPPENTGGVGGGDTYTLPLTPAGSVKTLVFPMVRLYPQAMYFSLTNKAGVALAATGNSFVVQPYGENIT